MRTHTKRSQASLTPDDALQYLKEGNERFQNNLKANRNLLQQVNQTSEGQFPFAVILSCIDSRTSAELIFDQGLGDIFSVRIAGNFINEDILGSLEYACKTAGSKLVVVLGHTRCGAINAACTGGGNGYIEKLLEKIYPVVEIAKKEQSNEEDAEQFANRVSRLNVEYNVEKIRGQSADLKKLEEEGKIRIVPAIYDVTDGSVTFF
ncbi:Carbonic anhydrase [Waddlia chondrophila 2032/99]|uniref:Carbonic anhydrase n=2 Tax=Waddlia chondrophila TaxID=71667 RepID=F8LAE4_9BACT|nr:carbonic anhydrase [Waddlia chondrophila]ADI37528.1 putative carbonic anhydrase [Waddlia chondrophila WSU 86-1044]CCB90454.1 Carbonic anhydrase [Waddlia chondrophila 2032/99]